MRKPIVIERSKCKPLWTAISEVARRLDYETKVILYSGRMIALKGITKEILSEAIRIDSDAGKELGMAPMRNGIVPLNI